VEAEDRVGEPAALAHRLEEARGRGTAEDRVEHAQREAPLVIARADLDVALDRLEEVVRELEWSCGRPQAA